MADAATQCTDLKLRMKRTTTVEAEKLRALFFARTLARVQNAFPTYDVVRGEETAEYDTIKVRGIQKLSDSDLGVLRACADSVCIDTASEIVTLYVHHSRGVRSAPLPPAALVVDILLSLFLAALLWCCVSLVVPAWPVPRWTCVLRLFRHHLPTPTPTPTP